MWHRITRGQFRSRDLDPRRESGQIIIIIAFAAIALFAMVGLAIDAGRLYITKAELSRSVDAAALSGILEFNGQASGLTAGEAKAEDYFYENEDQPERVTLDIQAFGNENEMTVDATKSVDLFFMSVLGIDTATVSAHARAGFGVHFLDAALVIDATGSMDDGCNYSQDNSGCPIYEAKEAGKAFKDILLGESPESNTAVGAAALRGCYRANPPAPTAPKPTSSNKCVLDDGTSSSWVTGLTYNSTTLENQIDNIFSEGGSGTNVCGGIAKGWEVLEGPGNHLTEEDVLRYMVILSDGDNNYYGHYTYQASPYVSPHTYQTLPCQPPVSCSNVGGVSSNPDDPCYNGVFGPGTNEAEDNFDGSGNNCPSNWSAGSGWLSGWTRNPTSGSAAPTYSTSGEYDTNCHVQIRGTGYMYRSVDLSSASSAVLSYFAKYSSWESGDETDIQVSTDGSNWTTLYSNTRNNTNTGYRSFCVDISAYAGQSNLRIRYLGDMNSSTADYFYVDAIEVKVETACSSDGFQDGFNGSPASCSTAVRRERQMDFLTWDMAKAIKADGVEIIIVGFGVCDPDPGDTVYSLADCNAQIGNTDHDNTADERLLKCMASSTAGTNDHYYYVPSAEDLPAIFTQIATQIAHRLIE